MKFLSGHARVHGAGFDKSLEAEALCALRDALQALFLQIAGEDAALAAHAYGGGEALPARGGAGVEHAHALFRGGGLDGQARGGVLHVEMPLVIARQGAYEPRGREVEGVRQRSGRGLDAGGTKRACKLRGACFERVDLDGQRRLGVIRPAEGLRALISAAADEILRNPARKRVAKAEVFGSGDGFENLRRLAAVFRHAAQDAVHIARGALALVFPAELHGLVHRRAGRDAVHKEQLRRAYDQDVVHDVLEAVHREL